MKITIDYDSSVVELAPGDYSIAEMLSTINKLSVGNFKLRIPERPQYLYQFPSQWSYDSSKQPLYQYSEYNNLMNSCK